MLFKILFLLFNIISAAPILAQEDFEELQEIQSSIETNTNQNFRKDLKEITNGHFGTNILSNQRDAETGLETNYNTFNDLNRVNFSLLFNSDLKDLTDIFVAELTFGLFLKDNKYFDFFINTQTNKYGTMTARAADITGKPEDIDATEEGFFSLGMGPTYRTFFIRDLIPIENIFETIHAGAALGWFFEDISNEGYFGPGVKANLGIHYRATKNFHIGTMLSWNHYWVKREEKFVDEDQGIRTLSLTWLAFGIDLAFYL